MVWKWVEEAKSERSDFYLRLERFHLSGINVSSNIREKWAAQGQNCTKLYNLETFLIQIAKGWRMGSTSVTLVANAVTSKIWKCRQRMLYEN